MKNLLGFNLHKKEIIIIVAICLAFLIFRLTNLTILPIFTDEAIYMRWAQLMWDDPRQRFASLADGKQPLQMWVSGAFMQVIDNQLWAARFPIVLTGLASMIGLWLLAWELFRNKRIAYFASILYLIAPPYVLHDRMAMADSMLAMWGIWAIYLNLLLLRTKRLDLAFILGFVYGLGLFTKSPSLFFWILAPIALLLIHRVASHDDYWFSKLFHQNNDEKSSQFMWKSFMFWKWSKSLWKQIGKYLSLWLGAVILGNLIASVMRLSELYYMVGRKELEFVVSLEEWIADPFTRFYGNMYGMSIWLLDYFGLPLVIVFFVGVIWGIIKRDSRIFLLLILALLPWLASASRAKVLYPRYLLFFTPLLMIITVYGANLIWIYSKKILLEISNMLNGPTKFNNIAVITTRVILFAIILFYPIYSSTMLIFNPPKAWLPIQDMGQYIEDTPSGYGLPEIISYLREEYSKDKKLVVGTEGTFGLLPHALEIEFHQELMRNSQTDPEVVIQGYWPFDHVPQRIMEASVSRPGYFIVYQYQGDIPTQMPLQLVKEIRKPGDKKSIRLYKVVPQRYFSGEKFNLIPR